MKTEDICEVNYNSAILRFWVRNPDDHIQSQLCDGKIYEEDLLADSLNHDRSDGWIVDVGANIGNHVITWACTTDAKILAIEPNPSSLEILYKNIELNDIGSQVEVIEAAAGSACQQGELVPLSPKNLGRTQVKPLRDGITPSQVPGLAIKPLDEIVGDREVSILKIDVEGMEHAVLEGARGVLRRSRPILYIETPDGLDETCRFLSAFGYRLSDCFASTPTFLFIHQAVDGALSRSQNWTASETWNSIRGAQQKHDQIAHQLKDIVLFQVKINQLQNKLKNKLVELSEMSTRHFSDSNEKLLSWLSVCDSSLANLSSGLTELENAHTQATLASQKSFRHLEKSLHDSSDDFISLENSINGLKSDLGRMQIILPEAAVNVASKCLQSILDTRRERLERSRLWFTGLSKGRNLLQNSDFTKKPFIWEENQKIYINFNGSELDLIKKQEKSTPGIFQRVKVRRDCYYQFKVTGSSEKLALLWVADGQKRRIVSRKIPLSRQYGSVSTLIFRSGASEELCVGVLFAGTAPTGSRAKLLNTSLHRISKPTVHASTTGTELEINVKLRAPRRSVCRVSIDYINCLAEKTYLVGATHDGTKVFQCALSSNLNTNSALFLNDEEQYIHIKLQFNKKCNVQVFRITLDRISSLFNPPRIDCTSRTITASMATYPPRLNALPDAVNSIVKQVDCLFIYLNNFDSVPGFLLKHSQHYKIQWILDRASRYRGAAKFYWANKVKGYHFLTDDDIIYPPDYAERMIERIEYYGRRAVLGVHGVVYDRFPENPVRDRKNVYNFQYSLPSDQPVNLVGTGTAAWHSDTMAGVDLGQLLEHPIANDEILAVLLKDQGISAVSPARGDHWMKSNPMVSFGIYEEKQLSSQALGPVADLLRAHGPWPEPRLPELS